MNNKNQIVTLKRGCPIAKLSVVGSITEITWFNSQNDEISVVDLEQINVPEEFKSEVERLLRKNRDLFVNEDRNLFRTILEKSYRYRNA